MNARIYNGPALFSCGFRPFFLLGSVYSGLAILIWLPVFMGKLGLVSRRLAARSASAPDVCCSTNRSRELLRRSRSGFPMSLLL